jgi:hypothetical protein
MVQKPIIRWKFIILTLAANLRTVAGTPTQSCIVILAALADGAFYKSSYRRAAHQYKVKQVLVNE